MDKYIKLDDALQCAYDLAQDFENDGNVDSAEAARAVAIWLADLPTADVRPIVHGKWIEHRAQYGNVIWVKWRCSICGYRRESSPLHRIAAKKPDASYCEICGADMREKPPE